MLQRVWVLVCASCLLFLARNFLVDLTAIRISSKSDILYTASSDGIWNDASILKCSYPKNKESESCAKFTLIVQTYKRTKLVAELLQHYAKSDVIEKIMLIWNNIGVPVDENILQFQKTSPVPINIILEERNSISNRFKVRDDITTDAVMIIDDDVELELPVLKVGYQTWKNHPRKMVGFSARVISNKPTYPEHCDSEQTQNWYYGNACYYKNGTHNFWPVVTTRLFYFHLVLPQALFMHRSFLQMYSQATPKVLLDMVDEQMNCDDLVLATTHAHLMRETAVRVWTSTAYDYDGEDSEVPGLHKTQNHMMKRNYCLKKIEETYGYMPLIESTHSLWLDAIA